MMLLRSKEEVLQSEKEMHNFVKSLLEQITLLEIEINQNTSLPSTSTSKEMKICQQKNVIRSGEKKRLEQLLVLAISKFQEVNGKFVEESNLAFVSITRNCASEQEEENEEEYGTDTSTCDEEVGDHEEEDWSDVETSSDEDIFS